VIAPVALVLALGVAQAGATLEETCLQVQGRLLALERERQPRALGRQVAELVRRVVRLRALPPRSEREAALASALAARAEEQLAQVIVRMHREAKRTRDPGLARLVAELYPPFLEAFPCPAERRLCRGRDMRFFYAELLNDQLADYRAAAREYTAVVAQGEGRFRRFAAYNAVLAYDRVFARAPAPESGPMPQAARDLLAACERYLALPPDGRTPAVLYKAGWLNYRFDRAEEATRYLQRVIAEYPDAPDGLAAAAAELLQELGRSDAP
jgi:hypothetical protein